MAMMKGGEIVLESNCLSARRTAERGFEAHCRYSWDLELLHGEFLETVRVSVIWTWSVWCQARMSHKLVLNKAWSGPRTFELSSQP